MEKNVKLCGMFCTPNILRVMKGNMMSGACSMNGRKERYTQGFDGKT